MEDNSMRSVKSKTREFLVEKGAIRAFARAIGDENPIYLDEEYAQKIGYASLVAPPTFPQTFNMPKVDALQQLDKSRTLHGEQEFIYERPIVAGDVLRCEGKLVDSYEKVGKNGGKMTFFVLETQGKDENGSLVYTSRTTLIYR